VLATILPISFNAPSSPSSEIVMLIYTSP